MRVGAWGRGAVKGRRERGTDRMRPIQIRIAPQADMTRFPADVGIVALAERLELFTIDEGVDRAVLALNHRLVASVQQDDTGYGIWS